VAKLKIEFNDPTPSCQRVPAGTPVKIMRPHLWAGYSGVVEKEQEGTHIVLIKGNWCDFQANVPGQMLEAK
jgi:hypothetical protein